VNVEEYARMYDAEERQWWYAGMRAISFALLEREWTEEGAAGRRLLDAGCGTGNNLTHFRRFGHTVGVDLSAEALRFCRQRGVLAVRGSVLSLPFPDESFDAVTSFDVLYHRWVTDDGAAVRELARVLKPGGRLLVRVPALKMLWGAHDEAVHSRHRYTRGELRALLEKEGLAVVKATYANSLLFPVIAVRRTLDRLLHRHGSDVGFLPPPLEWAFRNLLRLEAHIVPRLPLPVGASLFALARKGGPSGAPDRMPEVARA
jgi:SAM-dependent methyltransferase